MSGQGALKLTSRGKWVVRGLKIAPFVVAFVVSMFLPWGMLPWNHGW